VTLSLSLVFGLLLLAPGLAAFVGLYHGSRLGPVESPPPPPQSILALSFVTVGALGAHLFGAAAFLLQDLVCAYSRCFVVPYEPNVYVALFAAMVGRAGASGPEAVAILAALTALTILAFVSARTIVSVFGGREALKGLLYGWLGDLVVAQTPHEAVLAYVLSDVQDDGTVVGYEGVIGNITTNPEREITSVLLISCETFYLRVTRSGVVRRETSRALPIEQLYLDRAHIRNVAFERVRIEPDA
jgi:hypothetical protein